VTVLTGLLGVAVYAVALLAGADDDDPVRVCPACSARHEGRPAHCPDCGEPLDDDAERLGRVLRSGSQGYCSNCKSAVALDAESCPHCEAVF
jgi:predicted amidophosphoribosyltransferase